MLADDLRALSLFDGLTDEQVADLAGAGTETRVEPGVNLFEAGDHADHWWVLLSGSIVLVRRVGPEDVAVGKMDVPGRWAGGFRAWDADGVYLATGRGETEGRVFCVPAEELGRKSGEWFPFAGHLIEGLYRTARSIESTARQRESLLALGTLAAGLAHEINNPAAAAARAVDTLEAECANLLESQRRLASAGISPEQLTALEALRHEVEPVAASVGGMELADREDELESWLTDRGVERGWAIAPTLAAAGIDLGWCERAATELGAGKLDAGLEWLASALSIETLLAEVKTSTHRVSELVAAIKSYSQMDRASMQSVDLTEGLESTLVMLGHRLAGGVEVVRDYGPDLPKVTAHAGELNQVWTNLIDNAVDAMDGVGTLRITARANGNGVVVEVGDTGPGMPPEVAARAFEPFYSTKDTGKGTGLGLDIARRIVVDRHGGTITIDSGSGETVLTVSLPIRPAAS
jgi:signal transduction histidine kinase